MSMFYSIPKDEIRAGRFELDGVVWVPEWTCMNTETPGEGFFTCSACGGSAVIEWTTGGWGKPRYCPNCGAKVVE